MLFYIYNLHETISVVYKISLSIHLCLYVSMYVLIPFPQEIKERLKGKLGVNMPDDDDKDEEEGNE